MSVSFLGGMSGPQIVQFIDEGLDGPDRHQDKADKRSGLDVIHGQQESGTDSAAFDGQL